jgi:hypothetical protein
MSWIKYLKTGFLTIVVTSCAISDPNQGGLIGGAIGLGLGKYQQKTEELESELASVKGKARLADQQMQLSAVESERKHRELIELRDEINRIAEKARSFVVTPSQTTQNQSDSPDVQQIEEDFLRRMQAFNAQTLQLQQQATSTLANPTTAEDWKRVELLKKEVQRINEELEALWKMADNLQL